MNTMTAATSLLRELIQLSEVHRSLGTGSVAEAWSAPIVLGSLPGTDAEDLPSRCFLRQLIVRVNGPASIISIILFADSECAYPVSDVATKTVVLGTPTGPPNATARGGVVFTYGASGTPVFASDAGKLYVRLKSDTGSASECQIAAVWTPATDL